MTPRAAQPLTKRYGQAVRRKRFSSICRFTVLHQCVQPAGITGYAFDGPRARRHAHADRHVIALVRLRLSLRTVQAMETNLLVSAIDSRLRCIASWQLTV
jgi:hypothetical protein